MADIIGLTNRQTGKLQLVNLDQVIYIEADDARGSNLYTTDADHRWIPVKEDLATIAKKSATKLTPSEGRKK